MWGEYINIIESVTTCITKYVTFEGRASRSEFWWFQLFYTITIMAGTAIDGTWNNSDLFTFKVWESIFTLGLAMPAIAVSCRRLNDIGKSGWWQLIALTIIGYIPLVYWWSLPGDIKKREEFLSKKSSRWTKYLLVPISSILVIFLIIGFLSETSIIPNTAVQKGSELSEGNKNQLINYKIISKGDDILFFYSEGFSSILEGGQLITDDKIISYQKNEEGLIETYAMDLKNVKEVILEEKGSFLLDSTYKIIGNENAEYEYIIIVLSTEDDKDKDFINAIYKKIK